jgi:hypothetical protein
LNFFGSLPGNTYNAPVPAQEILMQDDVVALFAYDRWANTKVLDAKPRAEGSAARQPTRKKRTAVQTPRNPSNNGTRNAKSWLSQIADPDLVAAKRAFAPMMKWRTP